jgi:hypothetical protein
MFGHVTKGSQPLLHVGSDGTRVVGVWHRNLLIPCFGPDCVWEWRNIPQTVRKKYTTFSTERIVALRSVNKIFRRATVSQLVYHVLWPCAIAKTFSAYTILGSTGVTPVLIRNTSYTIKMVYGVFRIEAGLVLGSNRLVTDVKTMDKMPYGLMEHANYLQNW